MSSYVHLNGGIVPAGEARISPFDRGFLFGDGLFETMRVSRGMVRLIERHLDRMEQGAGMIGMRLPSREALRSAIAGTIAANDAPDCIARLTVSRGLSPGLRPDPDAPPTTLVTLRPLLHDRDLESVRHLVTLDTPHVPPATPVAVKSLNYLPSVLGAIELGRRGAAEGIMLTRDGLVAEGTVSNVFCVVDRALRTPPLELGVLPGITRAIVLELARERGVETREERFGLDVLRSADECFTTNSARGIVPALTLDGAPIGRGETGRMTRLFDEMYRRDVIEE